MPRLLLVHAHPDDESLFSALLTLRANEQGWQITLITMTDGALGFDPSGREGLAASHDADETVRCRQRELESASRSLGIDELVHLGYRDSGMAGWQTNQASEALAATPIDELVALVGASIDARAIDLVVTYGPDGFYGHPDHLACNRAVEGAVASRPQVCVLAPVVVSGSLAGLAASLSATGALLPDWLGQDLVPGVTERDIFGTVSDVVLSTQKQAALAQHRSQRDNDLFAQLEADAFFAILGTERYQVLHRGSDASLALAHSLLDATSNLTR